LSRSASSVVFAGRFSVDLAVFFSAHHYIIFAEEGAEVTLEGTRFLTAFGYSRLMGTDEAGTLSRLNALRLRGKGDALAKTTKPETKARHQRTEGGQQKQRSMHPPSTTSY
jgi:hypothetical protein